MAALEEQKKEVVKKVGQIDGKILDFEPEAIDSDHKLKGIHNDLDSVVLEGPYAAVQAVGPATGGGPGQDKTLSHERALLEIGRFTGSEPVASL